MAKRSGFSMSVIRRWVGGWNSPSLPALKWLSELFEMDYPQEFMYWVPSRGQTHRSVKEAQEAFRNARPEVRKENIARLYTLVDQLANETVELDLDRVCEWITNTELSSSDKGRISEAMWNKRA